MWIAKPLRRLSPLERRQWLDVLEHHRNSPDGAPLSQSLAWAEAVHAVGGESFLVFHPKEKVGGVLIRMPGNEGDDFECVNGPLLAWDDPDKAARQLATFAMGTAKLSSEFRHLRASPRWIAGQETLRLSHLPLEPFESVRAATWISPPSVLGASPRLRRTIRNSVRWDPACRTDWEPATESRIDEFLEKLRPFAAKKSFFVPDNRWFHALANCPDGDVELFLTSTLLRRGCAEARASHLIVIFQRQAHYLYGFQNRTPDMPAKVSAAALCHERAFAELGARGVARFDMNGFMSNPANGDPYRGVTEFKKQFCGEAVEYFSPTFQIGI